VCLDLTTLSPDSKGPDDYSQIKKELRKLWVPLDDKKKQVND